MAGHEKKDRERRGSPGSEPPVSEHFLGQKKFFDARENLNVVKILSGDCYVSTSRDEMLATILGSCVSACIRDPFAGIGGMNHFLLPGEEDAVRKLETLSEGARYGVYAMESLVNGILKAGGRKERLEVKVFGGGNVINNSSRIGSKNAQFIRDFLSREGLPVTCADLEGDYPRRVHYYPHTGKVMVRLLRRREDMVVTEQEAKYKKLLAHIPVDGDIELF